MDYLQEILNFLTSKHFAQLSATTITSFALIAAAEIGDKSQLVCMTLASRHRGMPVIWGAIAAFALLNTLAVVFGAAIAKWLPDYIVAGTVALLFAAFGLHPCSIMMGTRMKKSWKKAVIAYFSRLSC